MPSLKMCVHCSSRLKPKQIKTCGKVECVKKSRLEIQRRFDLKVRQNKKKSGVEMMVCKVCGQPVCSFPIHLKTHQMTFADYLKMYPGSRQSTEEVNRSRGAQGEKRAKFNSYPAAPPDFELSQFLVGTMLGDGHVSRDKKNGRYAEGGRNKSYMKWKFDFLRKYFPCTFKFKLSSPHTKTGKRYRGWWLRSCVHPFLTALHEMWYKDGVKKIPFKWVSKNLTSFALAVWFCDDGHWHKVSPRAFLYTMAFSRFEVLQLKMELNKRFGLTAKMEFNKKKQPFLTFSAEDRLKLRSIVSQHKIPGMAYKLGHAGV